MIDFEKLPQSDSEGDSQESLEAQPEAEGQESIESDESTNTISREGELAMKEEDEAKLREAREALGLNQEEEAVENQEEAFDSERAMQRLFEVMDGIEEEKTLLAGKGLVLEEITALLRTASQTEDPQARRTFRDDIHFQKLNISSKYWIRNSFDRDVREKVLSYLGSTGIETTKEEREEIKDFFKERDIERRKEALGSYAGNGLLTLKSAVEKRVLKETSSTPGDFATLEDFNELSEEESSNSRGYEVNAEDINDDLFYGRNSFARVALERGNEAIDRVYQLPKIEIENRLKNSMVFIVKSDKVEISRRGENAQKEDIVSKDINPEEIDYLLVDKANLVSAQEVYGDLPIQIIGVDSAEVAMEEVYGGPYNVPNFKERISEITQAEGPIWCHVARLPVDTYPEEFTS